jgi:molybdate transport system substrate-binding protein
MRIRTWFAAVAVVWLAAMQTAGAQSAGLHVLASNGMRAVIEDLKPQLEHDLGRPLTIEYGTTAGLRARIEGGESFDVTVLTTEVIDALAKAGKITSDSVGALGRSGVGVGVRAGAPKPDVGTADALKKSLLAVKTMTWVGVGASKPIIERMLSTLGIAADAKPKIVLAQSVDESVETVASGKVEMVLTLTSEILPAHGVQYVGPFPAELQGYVSFAGGVGAKSAVSAAGAKLVAALRAPGTARTYQAKGMELTAAAR